MCVVAIESGQVPTNQILAPNGNVVEKEYIRVIICFFMNWESSRANIVPRYSVISQTIPHSQSRIYDSPAAAPLAPPVLLHRNHSEPSSRVFGAFAADFCRALRCNVLKVRPVHE